MDLLWPDLPAAGGPDAASDLNRLLYGSLLITIIFKIKICTVFSKKQLSYNLYLQIHNITQSLA